MSLLPSSVFVEIPRSAIMFDLAAGFKRSVQCEFNLLHQSNVEIVS